MAIVSEKLHLFIEWKSEKFLTLSKNLVHKVLAYSMIDKVEKPRIGARLLLFAMKSKKIGKKFMSVFLVVKTNRENIGNDKRINLLQCFTCLSKLTLWSMLGLERSIQLRTGCA